MLAAKRRRARDRSPAVCAAHAAEMQELLGSVPTTLTGGSVWMRRRAERV